jgi:hypothetical protein
VKPLFGQIRLSLLLNKTNQIRKEFYIMENRKVLTKRKLIFAFLAALLIVAVVTFLSQQIAFTAYASSLDEFDIQEEILFDGNSEPLVDIEFEDGTLGWDPIVYAAQQAQHQVAAQIAQVSFQTYAAPSGIYGELRTMHAATKTKNQIIIYIIADRYTDSQQTTFFTDAQNIANHLINSFPISEYKEWVQIYAIGTISTSSSISIIAGGAGTASGDITRDNVRPFVQYHFPSVTNPSIANNHSWLVMQNG